MGATVHAALAERGLLPSTHIADTGHAIAELLVDARQRYGVDLVGPTLVSGDYAGHYALHRRGVVAAFCMAHARRKLFEAHALNGSEIAAQAAVLITKLYEIERAARDLDLDALRAWLTSKRQMPNSG